MVTTLMAQFNHRARKRFGQHFLIDPYVISQIITAIDPQPTDQLVEIGPGTGALTDQLINRCQSLTLVEIDRELATLLQQRYQDFPYIQVAPVDALNYNLTALSAGKPLRIFGNLPYNISTPLLFHLLQFAHLIQDMHFMLQQEVVDRLVATAGQPNYGRLTVMMQYYCQADQLITVPSNAFKPAPKVASAVVRLQPRVSAQQARDVKLLKQVVTAAFNQRRKQLTSALKQLISVEQLATLGIDSRLRAENLQVSDFVAISNAIEGSKN
jgi:16S rRNA (adenine1518-N6/adenine1519-N6)-dimethyltransferase